MRRLLLAVLLLAGCSTSKKMPVPPVPATGTFMPAALSVQPTNTTIIVSADFQPGAAAYAFFSMSTDASHWTMVATYEYPSNGATLSYTNQFPAPCSLYRAGFAPL